MNEIRVGQKWRGKNIREVVRLSNGWYVIKTDNQKSLNDFKVRTIFSVHPRRSITPKHAHFAVDLYGKICSNSERGKQVLRAIVEVWHGSKVQKVLEEFQQEVLALPGYPLEYILYALFWILEQEDINFIGRPPEKQRELDALCEKMGVSVPDGRKGSQLAISLLCDIASGTHPVEALLNANLDILPRRRGGGLGA